MGAPTTRATTVLWDIDGTLVRSGGVAAQAFLDAVAEVTGVRPTPERRDYGGRLDSEIADMRNIGRPGQAGRRPRTEMVAGRCGTAAAGAPAAPTRVRSAPAPAGSARAVV